MLYVVPAASSAAAALMLHTYGCLSLNLPQQLFARITLGSGGQKTMESATSQAKGCRVSKKANNSRQQQHSNNNNTSSSNSRDESTSRVHSSSSSSSSSNKEHNGVISSNCSDEENNEESNGSNVATATMTTTTTTTTTIVKNHKKNAKNSNSNSSSSSSPNNSKNRVNGVSSKVAPAPAVAIAAITSVSDAKVAKVAPTDQQHGGKAVGSDKATVTSDNSCAKASNRHAKGGKGSSSSSSSKSNDLSNNKAASKPVTNELSYSKVTSSSLKPPRSEMSYSDIVSKNGNESNPAAPPKVSSNNKHSANHHHHHHHSKKEVVVVANNNKSNSKSREATAVAVATNNSVNNAIDPEAQQRRAVLTFEQVCRLNDVMNEVVSIHGRGNFPTLEVRLRDLVSVVRAKLVAEPSSGGAGMKVRDIRLNGGAASHVLATECQPYNDLDLIFGVELSISGRNYDKIKAAVLSSLYELLPEGVSRARITTCSLKEAYVSKMVKVSNDGDRWSLISLGNSRGHRNVELKFVDSMRRQFEFSVDSFQIALDTLLTHEPSAGGEQLNEADCPSVVGESVYGDFHEALYHLQKKLISTRHPEEIRGGGLLKYCNLLVKMYKAAQPDYIKTLERYMCSRFFIDFPDIGQQKAKLESYLWNHFVGPEEEALKYQYLTLLHGVVEESTVCLMGHERRQTLALIEGLAYQVLCQQQQQRQSNQQQPPPPPPPAAYVYANGYYYAPVIPACYTCTCNSPWMACSS